MSHVARERRRVIAGVSTSTTFAYTLALLLIAAMSLTTHMMSNAIIRRQALTAGTVNLSGRQRAQAQRIVRISLQMADGSGDVEIGRKELRDAIRVTEDELHLLLTGSDAKGIAPPTDTRVKQVYFEKPYELNLTEHEFLNHAMAFANAPTKDINLSNPDLAEMVLVMRFHLFRGLNAVADTYQTESEHDVRHLQNIMKALTGSMLVLLLLEAFFIFRPLFRRLDQANAALMQAATTDPLTGSLNRRSFVEEGEKEFMRFQASGRPLTVMSLDLDSFKSINDTHGHATGDRVILAFVQTALSQLRGADRMGRLGGEEFAILLPDTDLQRGGSLAERFCRTVASTAVQNDEGQEFYFSVSVGVAPARSEDHAIFDVLGRADKLLYAAKNSGRNRVVAATV